jgi:hypothetical protein
MLVISIYLPTHTYTHTNIYILYIHTRPPIKVDISTPTCLTSTQAAQRALRSLLESLPEECQQILQRVEELKKQVTLKKLGGDSLG